MKEQLYYRTIYGGIKWQRLVEERLQNPKALENYGFKVYSQSDEDGIIEEIFNRIGMKNKEFIEFGVQNGLECNSHYLLHKGWRGLWIEGSSDFCDEMQYLFRPVIKKGYLRIKKAFITKDNIDKLIADNAFPSKEPDLLSIDIDGNDWYVWNAIESIKPRVVVAEYNTKFPPNYEWKQAYNSKHTFDGSDWYGASLKALELLGREKGYTLVGTCIAGSNAFFVRSDLVNNSFLKEDTAEALYNPSGTIVKGVGMFSRYCLVLQEDEKGLLNYFNSESEYKSYRKKKKGSVAYRLKWLWSDFRHSILQPRL